MILPVASLRVRLLSLLPRWLLHVEAARVGSDCVSYVRVMPAWAVRRAR